MVNGGPSRCVQENVAHEKETVFNRKNVLDATARAKGI